MKFYMKDFFSKFDQIRSLLQIWSHLLKKFLMDSFIFCAVISRPEMFCKFPEIRKNHRETPVLKSFSCLRPTPLLKKRLRHDFPLGISPDI